MKYFPVLFATSILAACNSTPSTSTRPVGASPDPVAAGQAAPLLAAQEQFLLDAAAKDFHFHRPPMPTAFKHVRVGHLPARDGTQQFILCGEFLAPSHDGSPEWTHFATIKTSDYEQWIGDQAAGFCEQTSIVWSKHDDLSATLLRQLDVWRSK